MNAKTLVDLITLRSVSSDKGITFISSHDTEECLPYEALYVRAQKALNYLQANGLEKGDELVMQVEDNKEFLIIFWACLLGGIIPVPLSSARKDDHKEKFFQVINTLSDPWLVIDLKDWEPLAAYAHQRYDQRSEQLEHRILCLRAALAEEIPGIVSPVRPEDIAFLQFSSGSTGNPKGVVLTHANLMANMKGISQAAAYTEQDTMLSWMPLTHDMGMIGFHLNPLFSNTHQYLMPTNLFVRHPKLWMEKASEHRASILCSPNFGYRYLLKYLKKEEHTWDLSCVRIIYNGAEPISTTLCDEFNERMSPFALKQTAMCPVYGLAEASVAVSISGLESEAKALSLDRNQLNPGDQTVVSEGQDRAVKIVNVGWPIDDCSVRIEHDGEEVREQVIGHIQIKGTNVTSGYYNNPEATNKVMRGDGWLDTGDLGFLKDGALYVTGRAKDIIFINGQNYYPHDIEKEAESVEGIELNKVAVVGAYSRQLGSEEALAFVFHRGALRKLVPVAQELKALINEKFGIELSGVIPAKNIPRTTSGKLQRFKLLEEYHQGAFVKVSAEFNELLTSVVEPNAVSPQNETEKKLLTIWEEVLLSRKLGVERKFFQSGGNSLKATELIMKMQRAFHVNVSIKELYQFPTVRKLAAEISNLRSQQYQRIPLAYKSNFYPISSSQKRIYYAWKTDPESVAYNVPVAIELKGRLDVDKLRKSLQQLITRQDALRMSFPSVGEPVLQITDQVEANIQRIACERKRWSHQIGELVQPFDLACGPLFRISLLEDTDTHLLFLDFHHIIIDGQSVTWFIEELFTLYSDCELLPAGASYRDFVLWEQGNAKCEDQRAYWTEQFVGEIPTLELPIDFPRPAVLTMEGKRKEFYLNEKTVKQLQRLSQKLEVSLHAIFFTLYNLLLAKYAGQQDIVIGIPVLGRRHPDLNRTLGMFVNNLAIRSRLMGEATFQDTVQQTFDQLYEAYDHQDVAFSDLIDILDISVQAGRNPLFDTMFMYQIADTSDKQVADLEISRFSFDPGFSKFDLSMEVTEEGNRISYALEYSTSLFQEATILRMTRGFERLVESAVANPEIQIRNLSPLSKDEYQQFVVDYNATEKKVPFKAVHELFEKQAERHAEKTALQCGEQCISYGELKAQVDAAAQALIQSGVSSGAIVGISLPKSPELVIAMLACLRAGAAYLPIDQEMPTERVKFILNDSRCHHLITDIDTEPLNTNANVLRVRDLEGEREMAPTYTAPTDQAYIIYTSGTTGQPKGVVIEHGSLHNYITWAADQYVQSQACTFALYSSVSFDLTVTSIFTPLVTGNKLLIYPEETSELLIEKVIRDNQTDVVKLTPSHLRLLCDNQLLSPNTRVKRFIVGGENLESELARKAYRLTNGRVELYNEYGPTEATVGCMIHQFNPEDPGVNVPIGRPAANTQIYLLDEYLKPAPVNVPGSLYIAGDGLAREYLGRKSLTTERFVENPFVPGTQMYVTGDQARRLPDGNLSYIGRNDQQVKISGYRIELAEVENQLARHPDITNVVVLPNKGANLLRAYYTSRRDELPESDLRDYLVERLPHYMVPALYTWVERMPLTRNGKVDTALLQQMAPKEAICQKESAQNEVEKISLAIWKDVLNVDDVGVKDNFFALGGDSIKAVQIASRLVEEGYLVKVKDILTYHTIRSINRYVKPIHQGPHYEQGEVTGSFTPTPIQHWFLAQRHKNPDYYHQSVLLRINEPLDLSVLEKTFEKLIRHHDTIRVNWDREAQTFFYNEDHLSGRFTIPEIIVDDKQALAEVCHSVRSSFDLSGDLLIKAALIKKGAEQHLFIVAHHLVVDGVSWRILMEDFWRVYQALEKGEEVTLPPKTMSFKAWSEHLREGGAAYENESTYWAETESVGFQLPVDFFTQDWSARHVKKIAVSLDADTTSFLLKDAHTAYTTDVPILLNVALVQALYEWTDQQVFRIDMEGHGRHVDGADVSRTLGWFTAMYPVRLEYEETVGQLIKSVKETLKNVPNHGIGYGINRFADNDSPSKISEIRFNYLGQFGQELDNERLSFSHEPTGEETDPNNQLSAKLELNAMVLSGKFHLEINYSATAFRASRIRYLADLFLYKLLRVLSHLKDQQDVHFTPSDFAEVDISEEELEVLFE